MSLGTIETSNVMSCLKKKKNEFFEAFLREKKEKSTYQLNFLFRAVSYLPLYLPYKSNTEE